MQSLAGEPSSEMGERELYHNNNNQNSSITTLKKFEVPSSLKSPPPLSIPAYAHRSIKTKPIVVTEDDALDLSDYFGGSGRSKDTSGGSLDDEVHHGKSLSSSSHHRSIASTIATTPSPSPPPPLFASVQVPFLRSELNLAPQSVTAYPPPKSTTQQNNLQPKPICIDDNNSSNDTWSGKDCNQAEFIEDDHRIDSGCLISSSSAARDKRVSFGTVQIRTYETILWCVFSCDMMLLFVVVLFSHSTTLHLFLYSY